MKLHKNYVCAYMGILYTKMHSFLPTIRTYGGEFFYALDRVFIRRFYLVKASKLGYVGNHDMRIITDAGEILGG